MANIKVKDLTDTQTINTDNEIMVLTNDAQNQVQNITVENLLTNVLSSDNGNVLEQGTDGKLYVETPENITGELSDLTTTEKSSLVASINEVDGDVGNLANLTTSAKTSVVDSINSEVSARGTAETNIQNDYNNKIGTLSNLDTTYKSNIVGAINEIAAVAVPSLQYETMNNSKALETGAPSTDAIILADIQKYAHSTYNSTPFTPTGNPTNVDGVASGFSDSDYYSVALSTTISTSDTFEFDMKFTTPVSFSGTQTIWAIGNNYRVYQGNTGVLYCTFWGQSTGFQMATSTTYLVKFIYDGTKLYTKYKSDTDSTWTTTSETAVSSGTTQTNPTITIGSQNGSNSFNGSIDLKYFAVTVNGSLVVSGNKTGIDTIKPDDYTVVGTPTISADGIASGFSASNYLTFNTAIGKNFKFTCEVYFTNLTDTLTPILVHSNLNRIVLSTDGTLTVFANENDSGTSAMANIFRDNPLQINIPYLLEVTCDGNTNWNFKYINLNNNTTVTETKTYSGNLISSLTSWVIVSDSSRYLRGSIDLNAFKIYVDGNLTYQPCLKIPYTQSKTGSKVVDGVYRDRVIDCYNYEGYAPYYTLDEVNGNFTLPQGEVYGMIERKANVDLSNMSASQAAKNEIVSWVMPDYANAIGVATGTVSSEQSYTCPSAGWLSVVGFRGNTTADGTYVIINDFTVLDGSSTSAQYNSTGNTMFIVQKGDTVKYKAVYTGNGSLVVTFIPLKGA